MASEQAGRDGGAGSASAPLPSSPQRNVGLALFASGVGVLGVGAVLAVLAHDPPLRWLSTHPWQLVVLALALALGEPQPIPVSRGDDTVSPVTISTTFAVALIVLGPLRGSSSSTRSPWVSTTCEGVDGLSRSSSTRGSTP